MAYAQTSPAPAAPAKATAPANAKSAKPADAKAQPKTLVAKKAPAAAPAQPVQKVAAVTAVNKPGQRCMRVPLSDVAFGTEASIAAARVKLDEYVARLAKQRGWSSAPIIKSAETTSCELYLDFGPLVEKEYRCLVTATFCQK
jgi:hypothetical protein